MNYLMNNLKSLDKTNPKLAAYIRNIQKNESISEYEVVKSRIGDPTIRICNYYIHSPFDPIKESFRFMKSQISENASVYVLGGFGLGYHIESLLELTEKEILIVNEPDTSLFIQALSLRDLRSVILSGRVLLFIGEDYNSVISALEQLPGKLVKLIIFRSLYEYKQSYYDTLRETVQNYISRKEVNISTMKRFGKLWLRNLSENAYLLARSPGIEKLDNTFIGVPALLVAAGPSLDEILPYIKELQKKFLLIAVDTALKACIRYGVEPDFTVVADPQYWNSRHLDRCYAEHTILVSDTSTLPAVFRQIKGKTFLYSSPFPLSRFLEEKTEVKGKLKAGGSVATAAWDLCRRLGVKEIICAGLDLGFPNKQTHYKGSLFEQRVHWLSNCFQPAENFSWHALIDAGLFSTKSNKGHLTWSDRRMSLYVKWFEEQMKKYPELKTFNLSDKGVRINGMLPISVKDIIKKDPIRKKINNNLNKVKKIKTSEDLHEQLIFALSDLVKQLRTIQNLAQSGRDQSIKLASSFRYNKSIKSVLQKMDIIDASILEHSGKDIASFMLQDYISSILQEKEQPTPEKIIENSRKMYEELIDSIEFNIKLIQNALKKSKKTQV